MREKLHGDASQHKDSQNIRGVIREREHTRYLKEVDHFSLTFTDHSDDGAKNGS